VEREDNQEDIKEATENKGMNNFHKELPAKEKVVGEDEKTKIDIN